MAHTVSVNGFQFTSGETVTITVADGSEVVGTVIRTGSNVVLVRLVDGTEREIGQPSITNIVPVRTNSIDVERIAWVLLDALRSADKAAAAARETVRALVAGGATIANPNVIALERVAIRLDEINEAGVKNSTYRH